jgi:hypothetical protein
MRVPEYAGCAYDATKAEFEYFLHSDVPADGVTVSATTDASWITSIDTSTKGKVSFSLEQNSDTKSRTATITLAATHHKTEKIKVIQFGVPPTTTTHTLMFFFNGTSLDRYFKDNIADAKVISQTAQQLQLLEQRGYSDEALCRLMGVPKIIAIVGDGGGNYRMPEHATQEFLLRTIQPRIREHEDELNSKLLSPGDFGKRRIHVCELALKRLDAKGQAEIDKLHLESGWSVNEIRSQYDLPNIPDGDDHYVSMNLGVVGSPKLKDGNTGGRPATVNPEPNNNGNIESNQE